MHLLLRLTALAPCLALGACASRNSAGDRPDSGTPTERAPDAASIEPATDGPMPDVAADGAADAGCPCPEIAAPVCGTNGTTYDNLCFAQCAGAPVACTLACPCPDECGECVSDSDCYPGQYCNAADVCLSWCACPTCDVCGGHCIAPTTCALLDCAAGYACLCGGAGPGPHLCQCGLLCNADSDCVDPRQDTCCDTSCTDNCTCYCR